MLSHSQGLLLHTPGTVIAYLLPSVSHCTSLHPLFSTYGGSAAKYIDCLDYILHPQGLITEFGLSLKTLQPPAERSRDDRVSFYYLC